MTKETFTFQAEVGKILDIVAHSLYSEKEVFLRELISNASDACDKLRYAAISDSSLMDNNSDFKIEIEANKKDKILILKDNGIGMSKEELIESLGTIAKSGTQAFMETLKNKDEKEVQSSLIGQFGVGFYSAFMVSDSITVESKKAGSSEAWSWTSDGKGSFEIDSIQKDDVGTKVILSISAKDKEYLDADRIETIVKKYSDHIAQPVSLKSSKKDEEDKVLNNASALWTRDKKDITADQYKEFYHHVGMAYDDPWLTLHNKAEGLISYINLLFIPSNRPYDLFNPDRKANLKLYVRRVFITEDCEGLIPPYLRFVKGIIDSEDLPLNVSREILQQNRVLSKIKSNSVKKVIDEITKLSKNEDKYSKFYKEFGKPIKEGLYQDYDNRDKLIELIRFHTTKSEKMISFSEYVTNMSKDQKNIYFLTGADKNTLKNSPLLEMYNKKGIEVCIFDDEIDDIVFSGAFKYKDFDLKSVTYSDAADELKEDKKESNTSKAYEPLIKKMKTILGDNVKDIKMSSRLTDSPCCLVADQNDPTARMQEIMKAMGQGAGGEKVKPIMEINTKHGLIKKIHKL